MKNKLLALLIVLLVIVIGCTQVSDEAAKQQAEAAHLQGLQAIINEDATGAAEVFSKNYLDLGDGSRKEINEDFFKNVFESEFYKEEVKGQKVEDIFAIENKLVHSYDELQNSSYKDLGNKGFNMRKGDVYTF
jgi:hypothetical protein